MTGRVIVVGNGPVGQTTALLLAKWGVHVVLLDRRTSRDVVGSKAICQQRDVLDIWESVGAGAQIAAEGVTWATARTFYRDRELFSRELPDPGQSRFPPFVNISQARTEEILDSLIAAQPLIDVRWGCEVRAISQDADGVVVEGVDGDYVVLCAGVRADALRHQLGVTFDGYSFDDRFLICDIRADLPNWARERRFYFDPSWNPGRQVLIHPCPGNRFRIDWQIPADHDPDPVALIRLILGDVPFEVEWKSLYRFQSRVVDRMRVGRVLLAGDCAHVYSPFGARGLNSGVADAENAAWKLAFVLNGWAPSELLESYQAERHAAAMENLAVTTATMEFLVPRDSAQSQRRLDVLERACSDAAAWSEVDSGKLSEPFRYSSSPLTTSPASGELVPDRPVGDSSLRQLARAGVLVLTGADLVLPAPVRVLRLDDLAPREAWVLRPDAHIAAVLVDPSHESLTSAIRRSLGYHSIR